MLINIFLLPLLLFKYIQNIQIPKLKWSIQSLNPDNTSLESEISPYFKKIISNFAFSDESVGTPYVTYLSTSIISADKGHSIKIDLPYENGDIGTDVMEVLYIKKEGEYFSIKGYNIDYYLNSAEIINSIKHPSYFYDDKDDDPSKKFEIDCDYDVSNSTYNISKYKTKYYSKYLRYSYLTFGLDIEIGKVFVFSYIKSKGRINSEDIAINEIESKEISKLKIKNFFLIDQPFLNGTFIGFHSYNNYLLIYEILLKDLSFKLTLIDKINLSSLSIESNDKIYKIGKYAENIYLLTTDLKKCVKIIGYENKTKWVLSKIGDDKGFDFEFSDFVLTQNFLYGIVKGKGMYILKIKDSFSIYHNLPHPYMRNVDFYLNPFLGNHFIGISTQPKEQSSEIFFELLINNEQFPRINKVIISSKERRFLPFYTLDNFFSYFFDMNSNELFLIRRGLLNAVPFISYKLNLSQTLLGEKVLSITSIYDNESDIHIPVLVTKDTLFLLEDLKLAKHHLNCTFNNEGIYNLTFIQRGEVCAVSLENSINNSLVTCQKVVKYYFHIYSLSSNTATIALICSLAFIIVAVSSFFCTLTCNSKCFKKWENIQIVDINKDETSKIYMNDYKFTIKKNRNKKINKDVNNINNSYNSKNEEHNNQNEINIEMQSKD